MKNNLVIVMLLVIAGISLSLFFFLRDYPNKTGRSEANLHSGFPQGEAENAKGKMNPAKSAKPSKGRVLSPAMSKNIKSLIKQLGGADIKLSQEAAERLAEISGAAVPLLINNLQGADLFLQGQTIFLLGRIGDKTALPALLVELRNENPYLRRNAAEALGKIKDGRALPDLKDSLFDDDAAVRERAAWALGELGDQDATRDLLKKIKTGEEMRVKVISVRALAKLKDSFAVKGLLNELILKTYNPYQNEVVEALGAIRDPRSLEKLIAYRESLKQNRPTEEIKVFQWSEAIKTAENAIKNIEKSKELI